MIKIEIIDPCNENPDVLVKTAAYLMELAGHRMVKAPTMEAPQPHTPSVVVEQEVKPKKTKKPTAPIPPVEVEREVEPPINCNTLVDKITNAMGDNRISHEEVMVIIKKHGLTNLKDIFTRPDLIAIVNSELDKAFLGDK